MKSDSVWKVYIEFASAREVKVEDIKTAAVLILVYWKLLWFV